MVNEGTFSLNLRAHNSPLIKILSLDQRITSSLEVREARKTSSNLMISQCQLLLSLLKWFWKVLIINQT